MNLQSRFRLYALTYFLVITYKVLAQGWVTDEATKDDSGGIFSGILGLVLLLGFIWLIGHIMDNISENRNIREKRKSIHENKPSQPQNVEQPKVLQNKPEDVFSQMLRYNGTECLTDKDLSTPTPLPSNQDLSFIKKEIGNCAITEILQSDKENAITDWWKDSHKDHWIREHGEADYSSDGKKLLFYWNKSEGYTIKEGVEILCDESLSNITSDDKDIVLPPTVKILGNRLYYYNWREFFVIPQSIEIITGNPYTTCKGKIKCLSPHFVYDNDILYDRDKKKIICSMWDYCEDDDKKQIDPHVMIIGRYAFYSIILARHTPLTIPSSVLYIGDSAFEKTGFDTRLSNGTIEIGDSAFAESHIHNFVLPLSVSKIGNNVFANCEFLEKISISPNIEVLSKGTFLNCKKLNNVYIPKGVKIIKNNCFKGCLSLNEVWLPNSLEMVEANAFSGCPLAVVVLSRSTVVEKEAFPNTCIVKYRD